jgi:coproporphyrinogen III oxidase-like Fe-S oxidoreductase
MACGTGAASYTDKARFSRPKTIKKYYDFVDNIENIELVKDTKLQQIETIILCRLRTVDGLKLDALDGLMTSDEIQSFKNSAQLKSTGSLNGFIIVTDNMMKLHPKKGFIVSNSVISDILLCIPEHL